MQRRRLKLEVMVMLALCSTTIHAAPPTPITIDDEERFGALTMALSAHWIGAVTAVASDVPVTARLDELWPDGDDDLDVDPGVALMRRWSLSTSELPGALWRHPHVVRVCLAGERTEARTTVYAWGKESVLAVNVSLSPQAALRGRVLPLAMPDVAIHPIVDDVDRTIAVLTNGRRCLDVVQDKGAVRTSADQLAIDVRRKHRLPLRYACSDPASIVDAASRFVDALSARTRDAVHALPQPSTPPFALSFGLSSYTAAEAVPPNERTLAAVTELGRWLPGSGAYRAVGEEVARRSERATVVVSKAKAGRRTAAVELQTAEESVIVYLAVVDGLCGLADVPLPWTPHIPGLGVLGDEKGASDWLHVGETWIATKPVVWVDTRIRGVVAEAPRERSSGMTTSYDGIGALDPEGIRRIVRSHAGQVRHCYESQLQSEPHLAGMLTMRWTIAPDGSVSKAEIVDSELRNDAVAACLVARIRTWVFPIHESVGTVVVDYPIVFRRAKPRSAEKPQR